MIQIGSIGWVDLTVENATELKDFYAQIIGFESQGVSMGDYEDYTMSSPTDGQAKVGICHARGNNAHIPPVWMVYFYVKNIDESLTKLHRLGGQTIGDVQSMGKDRYVFIKDPQGIACALYQKFED